MKAMMIKPEDRSIEMIDISEVEEIRQLIGYDTVSLIASGCSKLVCRKPLFTHLAENVLRQFSDTERVTR